jgi:hypothetical protein
MEEIFNYLLIKHPEFNKGQDMNIRSENDFEKDSFCDACQSFPLFLPNSSGLYTQRAKLTIKAVNQIVPFLCHFIESVRGDLPQVASILDIHDCSENKEPALELKRLFDFYGSDKASIHNYHYLYANILNCNENIKNIFEVGLGSNDLNIVSNMEGSGSPGASLRAFRDFCPNANIYGADIDENILFSDERIFTFHLDQTDLTSFDSVRSCIGKNFDLVIDDGLHAPNANIATLVFGLNIIRKGGWVVIEDIREEAVPLWKIVSVLLPEEFSSCIYEAEKGFLFAVQKC